ncbi:hypothetical protein [Janthinobacterium lividum]|uniref:hypothetical protein n=1 Tax=Janthinobacterium lividum TaxID=29581 RepID=UPI0015962A9F|nr:hypothetical protein [Janthinobacterium lividum]QKY07983.1 hypothetical protein G8765_09545 [Janthinobacterium lividum]
MNLPKLKELTDTDIKDFLETSALYTWRRFEYKGTIRTSLKIREIDAYCEVCEQRRPFQEFHVGSSGSGGGMVQMLKSGISYFKFSCVSCRKSYREYYIEQIIEGECISFQKFGERPRAKLVRNRVLQKFLKDDLENYEKAIICLSHEYGVAAFAYFRRVVENNVNKLLELVEQDAQSSGGDQSMVDAINELKKNTPMSERIKIANRALPLYLQPDGLNPLGRLYQLLSEGVHSLTDEECLAKAKAASECLTFLISELASRKEHRTQFKSLVGSL